MTLVVVAQIARSLLVFSAVGWALAQQNQTVCAGQCWAKAQPTESHPYFSCFLRAFTPTKQITTAPTLAHTGISVNAD